MSKSHPPKSRVDVDVPASGQSDPHSLAARVVAAGRARWPEVVVDEAAIATGIARMPEVCSSAEAQLSDLYLVLGSLSKVGAATRVLHEQVTAWASEAVSRVVTERSARDEVCDRLVHEMLFASPPRIAQYSGSGELKNWVRVAAVRTALNSVRGSRRIARLSDSMLADEISPEDPELAYARSLYTSAFKAAFREALAGLPVADRNLLRSYAMDGLNVRELGALYGMHASTASRQLAGVRAALRSGTCRLLQVRLGLTADEIGSVLRVAMSQADASVRRMLAQR